MANYRIGRIVNTFGIGGDIKVISTTDFPEERFTPGTPVKVMKEDQLLTEAIITSSRQQKGTYVIHLENYDNINDVEHFKQGWLAIDEEALHDLEEDAYYYHEIVGLHVYTTEDEHLGSIKDILALGSNDVWVVKRAEANKPDALIPYINDVVKEVNIEEQKVIVELMEGLIDDVD